MTRAAPRTPVGRPAFWFGLAGLFVVTASGTLFAWATLPALLAPWHSSVVDSGSMAPAIRPGDVVVWRVAPQSSPGVDSVVLFLDDRARPTLHRVVERAADGRLRTQGDANTTPDTEWVTPAQVQGYGQLLVPLVGLPRVWWAQGHRLRAVGSVVGLAVATWASRTVWRRDCDPWIMSDGADAARTIAPGELVDLREQVPAMIAPLRPAPALRPGDDTAEPDELFPPDVLRLLLTTRRTAGVGATTP